MTRIFVRLYGGVVVGMLLLSLMVYLSVTGWILPTRNHAFAASAQSYLREVATELEGTNEEERLERVAQRESVQGRLLAVVPLDLVDFTSSELAALNDGRAVVLGNELRRFAYARVDNEFVVELELLGVRSLATQWAWAATPSEPSETIQPDVLTELERYRLRYRPVLLSSGGFDDVALVHRTTSGQLAVVRTNAPSSDFVRFAVPIGCLLLTAIGLLITLRPIRRDLDLLDDVTERFGAGDLQVRANFDGSDAVKKVGHRFDSMADRIERLIANNEELMQAVAHELRTPLGRLLFSFELMEGADSDEQNELMETMKRSVHELKSLTSEILDYARLDSEHRRITAEPTTIETIARCVAKAHPDPRLVVRCHSAELRADVHLLARALGNLVSNALKFARKSVLVTGAASEGRIWIEVQDDGPGISIEDRDRVFQPFVRLDDQRDENDGSGLGLAIARRIIRLHGGTLEVLDWAQGCCFRIELPDDVGETPAVTTSSG
ncbi:MAG: ATP-binding protein [Polyangiales bacterium]